MASAQDASTSASTPGTFADEIREEGFTQIYSGPERPQVDIVIVHGLQGHPVKTWTHKAKSKTTKHANATPAKSDTTEHAKAPPRSFFGIRHKPKQKDGSASNPTLGAQAKGDIEKETYWPRDLLPKDFPNARVLAYGYDSHVSHFFRDTASQNNIITLGRDLLHNLVAYRVDEPTRPLFFVCHSLGGLVVKEASVINRSPTTISHEHRLYAVLRTRPTSTQIS